GDGTAGHCCRSRRTVLECCSGRGGECRVNRWAGAGATAEFTTTLGRRFRCGAGALGWARRIGAGASGAEWDRTGTVGAACWCRAAASSTARCRAAAGNAATGYAASTAAGCSATAPAGGGTTSPTRSGHGLPAVRSGARPTRWAGADTGTTAGLRATTPRSLVESTDGWWWQRGEEGLDHRWGGCTTRDHRYGVGDRFRWGRRRQRRVDGPGRVE